MPRPTRRAFLGTSALATLGLPFVRGARAATPGQRRFLFFFAEGGWDTSQVFEPRFGGGVDMPPDTFEGNAHGIPFTAGPDRLGVARFFERWGDRTCVINGLDTHSIGHGAGTRFVLTGGTSDALTDWPTLLASEGQGDMPMPHVVFSGPTLPGPRGSVVVRGGGGELVELVDGSAVGSADRPAPVLQRPLDALVDGFVLDRAAVLREGAEGRAGEQSAELLDSLERAHELEARRVEAGLELDGGSLLDRARRATELLRLGISRCAMIRIPGRWDTHGNNTPQGPQFDSFFSTLDQLLDGLAITPGDTMPRLLDELVIVCLSELGRTPRLNGGGGKDHWPFTSAMVVGPGVAGGRVVGASDAGLLPETIDLRTGRPSPSGTLLGAEHLGAALLKLGGLDPAQHLQGVEVLDALLA